MRALVRGVAASFAAALTLEPLAAPIVLDLARAQHEAYVRLLAGLVQSVTELPADDKHPGTSHWLCMISCRRRRPCPALSMS